MCLQWSRQCKLISHAEPESAFLDGSRFYAALFSKMYSPLKVAILVITSFPQSEITVSKKKKILG